MSNSINKTNNEVLNTVAIATAMICILGSKNNNNPILNIEDIVSYSMIFLLLFNAVIALINGASI